MFNFNFVSFLWVFTTISNIFYSFRLFRRGGLQRWFPGRGRGNVVQQMESSLSPGFPSTDFRIQTLMRPLLDPTLLPPPPPPALPSLAVRTTPGSSRDVLHVRPASPPARVFLAASTTGKCLARCCSRATSCCSQWRASRTASSSSSSAWGRARRSSCQTSCSSSSACSSRRSAPRPQRTANACRSSRWATRTRAPRATNWSARPFSPELNFQYTTCIVYRVPCIVYFDTRKYIHDKLI